MSHKLPTLSLVIPAYNEEDVIEQCLTACLEQTEPFDEIIVVDNNSSDKTVQIVKEIIAKNPAANIRLLTETVQGIAPTRNAGLNAATSEVIGRIDSDSSLTKNWAHVVRRIFTDPDIAAATGPVIYYDMPWKKFGLKSDDLTRKILKLIAPEYTLLFGSNMAIRRDAWKAIEDRTALDPEDKMHEDVDLALCLSEVGANMKYDSDMISGMSARRLEDRPRDFARYVNRFNNTYKYHGIKDLALQTPIIFYLVIYFPMKALRLFYGKNHEIKADDDEKSAEE